MNALRSFAEMKADTSADVFLSVLSHVAEKSEGSGPCSIGMSECKEWGLAPADALRCMALLVKAGILEIEVCVYDYDHDMYRTATDKQVKALDQIEPSLVRIWFSPAVERGVFQRFFPMAPRTLKAGRTMGVRGRRRMARIPALDQ